MSRGPDFKALVAQHGSPLLLLDCDVVRRQYKSLRAALPGVGLFYALKPLPHPAVVAELRDLGGCFDVATSGEIKLVKAAGVAPERCIHTHPIKTDAEIRAALRFGIRTFVVDNPDELRKFHKHRTRAEVLLRLSFRDPTAVVDLSRKFGCEPAAVVPMLELAQSLGVTVRGLSFHVGSQVAEPRKYVEAIGVCAELIEHSGASGLADLGLLDIGGGFPIAYGGTMQPIREFCRPIRHALKTLPRAVRVVAEPGRFIAGPSGTAISTVVGRAQREGRWWYYLDDGLYGSYNGQLYDHARYPIDVPGRRGPTHPSVLAGPTCDSIDVVREDIPLPELQIGDLVVGRMMGAYTACSATDFNFIPRAKIIALNTQARLRRAD
ncbi:MAG: type III PLP-dependent enzyme [Proteobacteria bacterium]|nr:type III PLP-dependent enzyme [Pseudomonadota bacterium]